MECRGISWKTIIGFIRRTGLGNETNLAQPRVLARENRESARCATAEC